MSTTLETQAVELRGHHLASLKAVSQTSKQDFFKLLSQDPCAEASGPRKNFVPYVHSIDDEFMKVGYDSLRALLEDSHNRIKLIENNPDFICRACPDNKKRACEFNRANTIAIEAGPWGVIDLRDKVDETSAKNYGLEIGRTYTANQIRQALGLPIL